MFPGYPKDFNAEGALREYSRNIAFPVGEWLNENFIKTTMKRDLELPS